MTTRLFSILLTIAALTQATTAASVTAEQQVELTTSAGAIHGTLAIPPDTDKTGKVPVILIIAGSGPTDRDGNSLALPGKNNSYKMLADSLAAEGIASLRYDKRGIAASRAAGTSEANLRFDMYVDDAAAWIKQLQDGGRFSRVVVAGHSEGSLIGMLAAGKARADAFVSIAGPARRASAVLRDQMRPQIGAMPALWEAFETILASFEAGTTVEPMPPAVQSVPALASLFRLSVQPYMISWIKYAPAAEVARLAVPVLIVQGTHDIQVSVDEARALKAAKPDAELLLVEGMNHVLKNAPTDRLQNIATYSNPDLPIAPDVPKAIASLARRIAGR